MDKQKEADWEQIITGMDKLTSDWEFVKTHEPDQLIVNSYFEDFSVNLSAFRRLKAGHIFRSLTTRELEILNHVCRCMTNQEIARALNISSNTVETHRGNIFNKLNIRNAQELILLSIRSGITN